MISKAISEGYVVPEVKAQRDRRWNVVCRSGEIGRGEVRPFKVRGRAIAVARLEEGSLRAVANTCPHEAARMSDGRVERMWHGDAVGEQYQNGRCVIICPWHNFEFDLQTGRSTCEPERMRLKTYRVEVVGEEVRVYV